MGLGHFGRGHLGRGHYGRGHFGRGHLIRGHFGPLIQSVMVLRVTKIKNIPTYEMKSDYENGQIM